MLVINAILAQCVFDIETSHLIYSSNQMTGFFMKCDTEL